MKRQSERERARNKARKAELAAGRCMFGCGRPLRTEPHRENICAPCGDELTARYCFRNGRPLPSYYQAPPQG